MTKQELIDCIHKVDAIYEKLVNRAQELYDLEHPNSPGSISGIDWGDSYTFFDQLRNTEIGQFVFTVDDRYDKWRYSVDTEKLADDFDIESYKKLIHENRKKVEDHKKKAEEEKERAEYERLKQKFETK